MISKRTFSPFMVLSSTKKLKTQPPPKGNYEHLIDVFLSVTKTNRMVYQKYVCSKQTSPSKTQNKWLTDCQITRSNFINWKVVYKLPFSCTKISKLIIFQFKLLQGRLATNNFLNKIGIRPDDHCTFCRDERESLIHLFWSCRETNFFWKNFQDLLIKNLISLKPNSSLSSAAVLGLKANFFSKTKQYFYFLVARYYIWTCKTRQTNPKMEGFPSFLSTFSPTEIIPKPP